MKNFNFDTTFTKGKKTYTIIKNEVAQVIDGKREEWLDISAINSNALIEHWLDKVIIPQITKSNPASATFEELIIEVSYLHDAISTIKSLKGRNCSYRNKSREELELRVHSIESKYYDKIQWEMLSTPQQLVLKNLSNRSTSLDSHSIQGLYNPVTDDDSKLKKWHKELMSFPYKKHGVNKESVIFSSSNSYYGTTPDSTYQSVLLRIEHFRALIKEAGDDLLNWSDQKISLRFTKLGIKSKAWEVSHYVAEYKEHLLSKGLKPEDKKKNTSKAKLEKIVAEGEATQDDNFRYYKQASAYDASKVLNDLDLEHLYMIIDSDLKCVRTKLFDKWDKPDGDTQKIALLLCEKSVTKQDYKKIINWATPARVTEAFMIKHMDHVTVTEVTEYCQSATISHTDLINDDFYNKCLIRIPDNKKLMTNSGLTFQYMVRMNESEKVATLKRIANDYANISWDTLIGLYQHVNYNLIKETILKSKELLKYLSIKLVKENDHAAMITCATTVAGSLNDSHKQAIFNRLSYDEKKLVIKRDHDASNFTGAIDNLSSPECLDLLKEIVDDRRLGSYTTAIFKQLVSMTQGLTEANKIVAEMENPDYLPLNEAIIKNLTVSTKVELLNNGIYLKDDKIYYSYHNTVNKTSTSLGFNFFNDFKRQDVDKVYDSPVSSEYRKYLAHTMNKDELELCVKSELRKWHKDTNAKDLQESFFRHNLELLGFSFLKQFQAKELFRVVVGDRRDRSNKSFGENLFSKLNVTNSIDFMFSDD